MQKPKTSTVQARQAKQGAVDIEGQILLPVFNLENEPARARIESIVENNDPEIVRTAEIPTAPQNRQTNSRASDRHNNALSLHRM